MVRQRNTGLRGFLMNWEGLRELGKQAHEARQGTRAVDGVLRREVEEKERSEVREGGET